MRLCHLALFSICTYAYAQNAIGTGAVEELYQEQCMSCHGQDLRGGLGNSLLNANQWRRVGSEVSFIDYVRDGDAETGMPAFKDGLSDAEIRSLEIYIEEMRQMSRAELLPTDGRGDGVYTTSEYDFRLDTVVEGLDIPWAIEFLPDGGMLITERSGALRLFDNGHLSKIEGIPDVVAKGQGGLLDVAIHPDYDTNAWIYLSYSAGDEDGTMTKVSRGRISGGRWIDHEVIFEVPESFHRRSGAHFGTRMVFQNGYLFFAIGDRGAQNDAQDLSLPNGKIHRIRDNGEVPGDNPFIDLENAYPTIWSYGNRNPQGLDLHPETGVLWESEHGPRGGDEINIIERGLNYGWPTITYGMNYSGSPITEKTSAIGMEQPIHYWTPSIAVCGMDFYEGSEFEAWQNDLFVGGLASQELHRLVVEGQEIVFTEIILNDVGRIRDVVTGPDGYIYLVFNRPGRVVRLVPVK